MNEYKNLNNFKKIRNVQINNKFDPLKNRDMIQRGAINTNRVMQKRGSYIARLLA